MIKVEKEKELLKTISQLFLNKIDEPKGIYMTEVSEFAEELERNLLAMDKRNQKIYLKRIVERFYDWIDETTISKVNTTGKPKSKAEKNLRALVFTVNYAKGCIETNIHRFLSKDEKKSGKEVKQTMLFKENCEAPAIQAFERSVKSSNGKVIKPRPIHIKSAYVAFNDLNIVEVSQTKFIQDFALKYNLKITGGKNIQIKRDSENIMRFSQSIISEYEKVK